VEGIERSAEHTTLCLTRGHGKGLVGLLMMPEGMPGQRDLHVSRKAIFRGYGKR